MCYLRQVFPQELIDAIIDASADDRNTLKVLSIASKAFVPRCRRHLFRSIEFSTDYGEEVLADRHQKFLKILAGHYSVSTYVQELVIRDFDPHDQLPWMITNAQFHNTLQLLAPSLKQFQFVADNYEWTTFSPSLKQAFLQIFSAPTLKSLRLQGLESLPSACCMAFSSEITELMFISSSFVHVVDPDLPVVHSSGALPKLHWLSLEDIDEDSIKVLLDTWVPIPAQGHRRPLLASLEALSVGPADEESFGAISELIQSGSNTIQYFYWDYCYGAQAVRPLHTPPLSLAPLRHLFAINYEVTFYPDTDFAQIPHPPDHFDGLLALLRTVTPGNLQHLDIKVDFQRLSDAFESLNEHDGWTHLQSLLSSDSFDQLVHVGFQIDVERGFHEDEMSVDGTFEERKLELEALLKSRLPFIREVESFGFTLVIERRPI